jgi:predicted HAD superfamily Cof-like phosphohydrolase
MIYDNLTDNELIREADGQGGLIKALSERLEMRQAPHSVFDDQAMFMRACGQTTSGQNPAQAELYDRLVDEELSELEEAVAAGDRTEEFDAVLDILVVVIGYGLSRGFPMNEGWAEVMRSNMAKIDPQTGAVRRREDGKILKPEGWTPPDLASLLNPVQFELF